VRQSIGYSHANDSLADERGYANEALYDERGYATDPGRDGGIQRLAYMVPV
jgi:hypothetical protein